MYVWSAAEIRDISPRVVTMAQKIGAIDAGIRDVKALVSRKTGSLVSSDLAVLDDALNVEVHCTLLEFVNKFYDNIMW